MAFSGQFFKAPGISDKPKMGKKTVSSSIFGGAFKPKLKTTSVSASNFSSVNKTPKVTESVVEESKEYMSSSILLDLMPEIDKKVNERFKGFKQLLKNVAFGDDYIKDDFVGEVSNKGKIGPVQQPRERSKLIPTPTPTSTKRSKLIPTPTPTPTSTERSKLIPTLIPTERSTPTPPSGNQQVPPRLGNPRLTNPQPPSAPSTPTPAPSTPAPSTPSNRTIKASYNLFRGHNVDPKYLPKKPQGLEKTLIETNSILVEIQQQLAIDFASRISEREDSLKAFRKQSENNRRSAGEKSLESVKGFGKTVGKLTAPIIKPFRNVFDRLLQFFGAIATGFLANAAFKWLSKDENREKIVDIFNFITDNWKIFAGILVGGLALNVVRKLARLVTGVRAILQAARILPKGPRGSGAGAGGGGTNRTGGFFRNNTGQRRGFTTTRSQFRRMAPTRGGGGIRMTPVAQYNTQKTVLGKALQSVDVGFKKAGSNAMKAIGMGPGAKGVGALLKPLFKRIPFIGPLINFGISLALGEPIGRAAAKGVGSALGAALGSFPPLIPFGGPIWGGILGDILATSIYDNVTKPKDVKEPEKMTLGGKLKGPSHSGGGIPMGGNQEAEGGEYVVKKIETMRFEPVLDDINYSGGKLYKDFAEGAKQQSILTRMQFKTAERVGELYEEFDKFLESKKNEKLLAQSGEGSGGTGGGLGPLPQMSAPMENKGGFKVIQTPTRDLSKAKNKNSKINTINLPPVVMNSGSTNIPTLPGPQESERTIPAVLTYDPANEYLDVAIESYDIVGVSFGG